VISRGVADPGHRRRPREVVQAFAPRRPRRDLRRPASFTDEGKGGRCRSMCAVNQDPGVRRWSCGDNEGLPIATLRGRLEWAGRLYLLRQGRRREGTVRRGPAGLAYGSERWALPKPSSFPGVQEEAGGSG